MVGERLHLQVQVQLQVQGREFETRFLHVGMEDVEMESGGCSGQSDCKTVEERSEMELRERSEMEKPEWMEGETTNADASIQYCVTQLSNEEPCPHRKHF